MQQPITVKDKQFTLSISSDTIQNSIQNLANKINEDYQGKEIFFIGVLNGVFMFAADLLKRINIPCTISFTKVASYEGTQSTGKIKQLIGLPENLEGKNIVILEDIVDTGFTMKSILNQLKQQNPADIKIATLLFKPDSFKENYKVDYRAIEIPNAFIVGYGLDYDGFGRNLPDIYTVVK
ncbi:MAG: hypoxanthine phosphoribosyltransferase [Bacteroidales bacterium]|nr:hypoxanthine phosphoribosyltransferase [Bacteroidales bacterium]